MSGSKSVSDRVTLSGKLSLFFYEERFVCYDFFGLITGVESIYEIIDWNIDLNCSLY